MQIASETVFSGSASAYGTWFDIGHMTAWSLHVTGAEAGATFNVYTSNEPFIPSPGSVAHANAVQLGTITPTNGVAMYQGAGVAHWLQIQKVASTGPTASVVTLFGHLF